MKLPFRFLYPWALVGAFACRKDVPEAALPAATQYGLGTGGCLLNGSAFVATGVKATLLSNAIPALAGGFYQDSLYALSLRGQTDKGLMHVYLFLRKNSPGTYALNRTSPSIDPRWALDHALCSYDDTYERFATDARHTGQLTLTYTNKALGISAGTFAFTAVSSRDATKTITVTSGRFDNKQ